MLWSRSWNGLLMLSANWASGSSKVRKNKLVDNLCLFTHCVHQKQSFGKYQLTTTAALCNLTNKMVVPKAWKHGCSCCEQCIFSDMMSWKKGKLCNNLGLLFMLNFPSQKKLPLAMFAISYLMLSRQQPDRAPQNVTLSWYQMVHHLNMKRSCIEVIIFIDDVKRVPKTKHFRIYFEDVSVESIMYALIKT